jgi:hypothetical protein
MVKAMWRESGSCVRSQELMGARVGHGYRIAQFAVLQDIFEQRLHGTGIQQFPGKDDEEASRGKSRLAS